MPRAELLGAFILVTSATAIFACSEDRPEPLAVTTPSDCPTDVQAFRFPGGTGDGHTDPFGAKAAGQARAGRIRDASRIVQPVDARHKVRPGDFVLANDRIAVYVESEARANGYAPFGGEILAIEPVGDDGRPLGISEYGETLITLARQTVKPDAVTVLADGSDGKAAIVRVSGVLTNVPFFDTFRALASEEYGYPAAFDYVLEPGAEKVTVRLSVANPTSEAADFGKKQFLGFFHAHRGQPFTESRGFAAPKGETPWVGWDAGRYSLLARTLAAPLRAELEVSGFQLFSTTGFAVDACGEKTVDYLELAAAAGGVDALLETKRRVAGEPPWREIRGTVKATSSGGSSGAVDAGAGVLVHAVGDDGRYLTRTTSAPDGTFLIHAPPGAPFGLVPTAAGFPVPAATTVAADLATTELLLPAHGTLDVSVEEAVTKRPLPARVQVLPDASVPRAPESFGVRDEVDGRLWQEYAVNGKAVLPVPPGAHRVVVSRGYEYEIHDAAVSVSAGATTPVTASLVRSVDGAGVMCADFHVHTNYSVDAIDAVERKVKGAIADGLEIPVSSEHEWIIDFQPTIAALGLTEWAYGFPSEELTTFSWGHFGVIPLFPRPEAPNNGAIDWVGKKPAEIFAQVNALPERPILVVNHPRGPGFFSYFSAASFDPATLQADPELWSEDFGAIEVFNDSDLEENRTGSVADWFALLTAGRTKWAVGNSDSHDGRTRFVGYPRTCLRFGHDDPRLLSAEAVRDVLRTGDAVINGGITMTVSGPRGVPPGGTAEAGPYRVVVASPSWITPTSLEVIVDGQTTQTLPLTTSTGPGPGKRYELTVDVQPTESRARHWVVFHAKGAGDLEPVHPRRRPFAVSNPIFF